VDAHILDRRRDHLRGCEDVSARPASQTPISRLRTPPARWRRRPALPSNRASPGRTGLVVEVLRPKYLTPSRRRRFIPVTPAQRNGPL